MRNFFELARAYLEEGALEVAHRFSGVSMKAIAFLVAMAAAILLSWVLMRLAVRLLHVFQSREFSAIGAQSRGVIESNSNDAPNLRDGDEVTVIGPAGRVRMRLYRRNPQHLPDGQVRVNEADLATLAGTDLGSISFPLLVRLKIRPKGGVIGGLWAHPNPEIRWAFRLAAIGFAFNVMWDVFLQELYSRQPAPPSPPPPPQIAQHVDDRHLMQ